LFRRGGVRAGAGRKPAGDTALVSHGGREAVTRHTPVLVTTKLVRGLPNLRRGAARQLVLDALRAGKERFGARVVHFSIQSNHLHAIVEANDARALSRAMKGLCVRLARTLNRAFVRAGRVFADRYHARVLRTPREVRYALAYTLGNARKHGVRVEGLDPCSSGAAFDGWKERGARALARFVDPPVEVARSWLLRVGWKRHGLIGISEIPGADAPGTSRRGASAGSRT
jgi:REP element-mobilizing transposase RayT